MSKVVPNNSEDIELPEKITRDIVGIDELRDTEITNMGRDAKAIDESKNKRNKHDYYANLISYLQLMVHMIARILFYTFRVIFVSFISFKAMIVLLILLRKLKFPKKIMLRFKLMFDQYTDDDYKNEEDNPIAVETLEAYLDFKNYFYDTINYFLRTFINSKLQDSEVLRSFLVKDHLQQEQTEYHNASHTDAHTDAIIKIKKGVDGELIVRLNAGNLFGLVINNSNRRMLSELLSDARKLNEDIRNIFLEKYHKDFYDKAVKYDDNSNDEYDDNSKDDPVKAVKLFFGKTKDNSQFQKSLEKYYVFETRKTIYSKLNDFMTGWLIAAANNSLIGESQEKSTPLHFDLTNDKPTYESLFTSLKQSFVNIIREKINDFHLNVARPLETGYKILTDDLHRVLNDARGHDTFYIDEIKRFIHTTVTRTRSDMPDSILDKIVQYMIKEKSQSRKFIPCSFVFEKVRLEFKKYYGSPWTTDPIFGEDEMRWEKWQQRANSKAKDPLDDPSDTDIMWLRNLLEESRRYKNRDAESRRY